MVGIKPSAGFEPSSPTSFSIHFFLINVLAQGGPVVCQLLIRFHIAQRTSCLQRAWLRIPNWFKRKEWKKLAGGIQTHDLLITILPTAVPQPAEGLHNLNKGQEPFYQLDLWQDCFHVPLDVQGDGGFVAQVLLETLAGLPDEEPQADGQQDQERDLPFPLPDPSKLKMNQVSFLKFFRSLPPPWWIFYLLGPRIHLWLGKWLELDNESNSKEKKERSWLAGFEPLDHNIKRQVANSCSTTCVRPQEWRARLRPHLNQRLQETRICLIDQVETDNWVWDW